jgi:hypothetical protein
VQTWTEADVRRDGINIGATVAEMQRRGAKVRIVVSRGWKGVQCVLSSDDPEAILLRVKPAAGPTKSRAVRGSDQAWIAMTVSSIPSKLIRPCRRMVRIVELVTKRNQPSTSPYTNTWAM